MAAKKKPTKKKNSSTNTTTTTILPKPMPYPLTNKKPEEKKQRSFHAVGVLQTEQEVIPTPYHEKVYQQFTLEEIANHIPQYNVIPYSHGEDPKPLSAAQITQQRKKKNTSFPKFFMNPYQDLD